MRSRTYLVDLDKKNYQVANYKQYDNNIEYSIHLVENGIDVSLAGCTVFALFRRKDGKSFQKTCTIKDSVITTLLDNNILELDGIVKSEFRIYKGDVIVTTFSITISVEDSINIGDAIDSVPGADLIGTIMDLQKEIEEARDGENSLKDKLDKIEDNIANHTHPYAGSDTHGGSANSAKKLETPKRINGTLFDGTTDITTDYWGDSVNFTIGNSTQAVNGSGAMVWTLDAIGASTKNHNHGSSDVVSLTGYVNNPNGRLPLRNTDTLNEALSKIESTFIFHEHETDKITALNGYNKGNHNGALTTNDSLNIALAKLENNIDDSKKYTDTKVADLVNSAPATLDTLKELADALGNDPNFATTVANQIGQKADTTYVDNQLAGKADTVHTHTSNQVNAMTGYAKPNTTSAIVVGDTLNQAIGKLERALDNKQSSGNYLATTGGDMTGNINFATDNRGLTHAGRLYLRGSANSTVLSCATGGQIYLRPNGDANANNQVVINNNGQVTAPLFNGNLTGNATTATTLQTAREIKLQGDVTGTANFNGSADAVITSTLANVTRNNTTSNQSPNFGTTFTAIDSVTTDTKGRITGVNTKTVTLPTPAQATDTNVTNTLNTTTRAYITGTTSNTTNTGTQIFDNNVYLDTTAGHLTATQFNGRLNGNANTATSLQTARKINGTDFNGTTDITTAKWGTARSITIGNTTKQVDGSGNVTWTLQEIGAGAGGGITSITTNGQTYNAVGNNITLPNHLLLTGGTVTGTTNFNQGINCQAVSVFTGVRSEGTNPATGFSYWSISAQGNGSFNGLQAVGETLFQGQVTTHRKMRGMAVDGSEAWSIERDGSGEFKNTVVFTAIKTNAINPVTGFTYWSVDSTGNAALNTLNLADSARINGNVNVVGSINIVDRATGTNLWSITSQGNASLNEIRAVGAIYGKNRIALNNGTIYLPQGGGNTVCDHLRIGGGFMACKDDGTMHFLTSGGNPTNLYGAGFIQGSDIKLKENIRYIDAPKKTSKDIKDDTITKDELFNFIKNLKVCEYNYIESDNDKIGFIANDIVGDKVGDKILLEDGGVLSYDTSNMLFATIGALQEEIEKRESLKKENEELKDRLKKIEEKLGI